VDASIVGGRGVGGGLRVWVFMNAELSLRQRGNLFSVEGGGEKKGQPLSFRLASAVFGKGGKPNDYYSSKIKSREEGRKEKWPAFASSHCER